MTYNANSYISHMWRRLNATLIGRFLHMWLFLLKHKLELMFSSIDPCAPLICDFLAIDFPPLELQTKVMYFILGSIVIGQLKDLSEHAFTSQSAPSSFTCSCTSRPIAVDLHSQFSQFLLDSSVYFPSHPPLLSRISRGYHS